MLTGMDSGGKNKPRKITQETTLSHAYGRNKKLFTEMGKKSHMHLLDIVCNTTKYLFKGIKCHTVLPNNWQKYLNKQILQIWSLYTLKNPFLRGTLYVRMITCSLATRMLLKFYIKVHESFLDMM